MAQFRGAPSVYTLFETSFGVCGIAWQIAPAAPAVTCFQLPEQTETATEARLMRFTGESAPTSPPPEIEHVIGLVQRHLEGELQDFLDVDVALLGVSPFILEIYRELRLVPPGNLITYAMLAIKVDRPEAAQAVGQAMARNPIPLIIPCHRVVGSNGKLGGFSAPGGQNTKVRLLKLEGAVVEVPPKPAARPKAPPAVQSSFDF